ncbi:YfiM family protein [Chitinophagales bacterium]|nr:YfiM family protein [Chitinophagales bacterium]
MKLYTFIILSLCLHATSPLFSQKDSSKLKFFTTAPVLQKERIIGLTTGLATSYTAAMLGLNYIWYKDSPRTNFHFFNDAKEWKQVDKMGHVHTAYFESVWSTQMLRWAGVDAKKAAIYGSLMGFGFQTSIEIFDGFSDKWGASLSDIGFNALGSGLALTQNLLWDEQRIRTKYSFHQVTYPDSQLEQRAIDLYGTGKVERIIKDYNSLAIWLSITPSLFMNNPRPQSSWLALSLGYMGGDMYGGFENRWEDENGTEIDRTDIKQYRRFFFSLDVDFEQIPAKKHGWKTLLRIINIVKAPMPALEVNTRGEIVFHPMFYLNWNKAIVLKN